MYASTELVVEGQDDGIDEPESRPVQECGFLEQSLSGRKTKPDTSSKHQPLHPGLHSGAVLDTTKKQQETITLE